MLTVGLMGCGNIAPAYVRGIAPFANIDLVACADVNEEVAQAFASEHGLKAYSVDDLLASDVDIIVNLTPPLFHADVDKQIIKAGKHVYSEKPFAVTLEGGKDVIEAAQTANVRVGCAPDTFLGGGVQTCRKLIDEGAIGTPVAATAFMAIPGHESWHPNPAFYYDVGGGPMLDMGPYYLTAMVNLLGTIRRVTGVGTKPFAERTATSKERAGEKIPVKVDTSLTGLFEFENGAVLTMVQSFDVQQHNLPIIEVYGSEGTLAVPDPNTFGGAVRLWTKETRTWENIPLTHSDKVARGIGVADMGQAIEANRPHRASGKLAFHVLEAMLAVSESSEKGQHINLNSSVERPAPLPIGLQPNEID